VENSALLHWRVSDALFCVDDSPLILILFLLPEPPSSTGIPFAVASVVLQKENEKRRFSQLLGTELLNTIVEKRILMTEETEN
jgi:hypothetical protein